MAVAVDKHIEILPKAILTGIPIPVNKAASPPAPIITVAVISVLSIILTDVVYR